MIQNCKYKKVPQLPSENDILEYSDDDLFQVLDLNNPTDRELEAKLYSLIDKYHSMKNNVGQQMKEFYISIFKRFFETEEDEEQNEQPHQRKWEEKKDDDAKYTERQDKYPFLKEGFETKEEGKTTAPAQITNSTQLIAGETPTYTKNIDYTRGSLNPILKETIKRVVSIDSSFRNTKTYPYSTEFTFNLTETLHDVVSLKLYSVSIPYNWYTINQNFGSNFFYIKGISDGINNGNFDYKVSIDYGNYSAETLIESVSKSIKNTVIKNNPDIMFGGTDISYNQVNGRSTLTLDIKNIYNETNYYMYFPTFTDISTSSLKYSIPELFGYTKNMYYPFSIYSNPFIPNTDSNPNSSNTINYVNNSLYILTTTTNSFNVKIYQPRMTQDKIDNYNKFTSYRDITEPYSIEITVFPNAVIDPTAKYSYSGTAIFNELNAQLKSHPKLVQNYDMSGNVIQQSLRAVKFGERNYAFELNVRPNRRNSSNEPNQKMVVVFPDEDIQEYVNTVWTGSSSLFNFPSTILEFQDVRGEYNSSTTTYFVHSGPYILLRCIADGYYTKTTVDGVSGTYIATDFLGTAVDINDYKIVISNSPSSGYILSQYYSIIQNSFDSLEKTTNGQVKCSISNTSDPNYNTSLSIDINKVITTDKFYVDTSESFFNKLLGFETVLSGGVSYTRTTSYSSNIYTVDDTNNTFRIKPVDSNNPETSKLGEVLVTIDNADYSIYDLATKVNEVFNSYYEKDGSKNINLSNCSMTYNILGGQILSITFIVNIQSVLKNKDYVLYFFDVDSIAKSTVVPDNPSVWYYSYRYVSNFSSGSLQNKEYYYKWKDSNGAFVTTNSWGKNFGFTDPSYSLVNANVNGVSIITGTVKNQSNLLSINSDNNFFQIKPIYDPSGGAYNTLASAAGDSASSNTITLTLDLPEGEHTKEEVRDSINRAFYSNPLTYGSYVDTTNQIVSMRLNVNKIFTAKDYSVVFYDSNTFTQCIYGQHSSAQVTTADTTLGWKMGFRSDILYNLTPENVTANIQNGTTYYKQHISTPYTYDSSTNIAALTGDTSVNVNLYNYFLIILDDYTQNHLNDGLITTTILDTDVPLPSYASKASRKCMVTTDKEAVTNTTSNNNFNQLTNAQLYSANQILNTQMSKYAKNVFSSGPFAQDIFGMIPMKTAGLSYGQTYSEFGGTLQIQERVYFGPVNITRMTVRLITDKGNVLDLNNQNWSFSLITEQLYNPNKG